MTDRVEKPKVIIFDVNETLLDLANVRGSVGEVLKGKNELVALWFSTMLHHSLVTSAIGDFQDFGDIGVAALMMVAQDNNIEITEQQANEAISSSLLSLPPHPEVTDSLEKLKAQGYRLVCLTNSSNQGVEKQMQNAGLSSLIEKRMSIEGARIYKPNLRAYEWALEQLKIKPEDALMVAAHGWDVAGAKAAGLQTAFVARQGKSLYPLASRPDLVVDDLKQLVEALS